MTESSNQLKEELISVSTSLMINNLRTTWEWFSWLFPWPDIDAECVFMRNILQYVNIKLTYWQRLFMQHFIPISSHIWEIVRPAKALFARMTVYLCRSKLFIANFVWLVFARKATTVRICCRNFLVSSKDRYILCFCNFTIWYFNCIASIFVLSLCLNSRCASSHAFRILIGIWADISAVFPFRWSVKVCRVCL